MVDSVIFAIVIVLLVLAAKASVKHFSGKGSCCSGSGGVERKKKTIDNVKGKLELKVEGMHCEGCEERLAKALDGINGAAVESIDWKSGLVSLILSRELSDETLERVVSHAGYRLVSISR